MARVVKALPGLRLLIVMVNEGNPVEGWLNPNEGNFDSVREIMNEEDNDQYPRLLTEPS